MSLYFFHIATGRFGGPCELPLTAPDYKAALTETNQVCADLLGCVLREFSENSTWQVELLDESRKTVFRVRLVSETLS
jgi:hypothetical protein